MCKFGDSLICSLPSFCSVVSCFCAAQIRDFSAKLNNYITSCVLYFKSQWLEIRSNAATLVGQHPTVRLIILFDKYDES